MFIFLAYLLSVFAFLLLGLKFLHTFVYLYLLEMQFNFIRVAEYFLDKDLVLFSLLVKYYVLFAHINKVRKLVKFNSAMNLQLSRLRLPLDCDLNFKSFKTLLICAKGT